MLYDIITDIKLIVNNSLAKSLNFFLLSRNAGPSLYAYEAMPNPANNIKYLTIELLKLTFP